MRPTGSLSRACCRTAFATAIVIFLLSRCAPANAKSETDEDLARHCRKTIAASTSALVKSALTALDACHTKRDTGRVGLEIDCNAPDAVQFSEKQRSALAADCPDGNLARANYEVPDLADALQLFMTGSVAVSGEDLQGDPDLTGKDQNKQTTLKENRACHKEIGKQRSKIVTAILKGYEAMALLATQPEMGRARPELGPTLRSFPVGQYVLFYDPSASSIDVVRVLSGSRDVDAVF